MFAHESRTVVKSMSAHLRYSFVGVSPVPSQNLPWDGGSLIGGLQCMSNIFSLSSTDTCSDLNSELQRVLTGLENVVCGRKKSSCSLSVADVDRHIEQLTTASEHCDLAIKVW